MINISNITANVTSNITNAIVESSNGHSISYTGIIISASIFISVALVAIVINTKCSGVSEIYDFINIFK